MNTPNRPPTKDEYEAILAKFKENRLEDAVLLMEQIPTYQRKTPLYRQQLSALSDAESRNVAPEIPRNQISNGLLKFIQDHEPQEAYTPPVADANQTSSQAHTIIDPDAPLLWISEHFLGREEKIADIKQLLGRPEPVDIIVSGAPGNGKTTIAHHVLRQWLLEVPGRIVYLVEVEFITTVPGLVRALGGLCGLKPEVATIDRVLSELAELPNGVLYLDNLESVLDETEAHRFLARLQRCANLVLLASSRRLVSDFEDVSLNVLDDNDAIELFQLIWQQQIGQRISDDQSEFLQVFVTKDLGKHPLSIEITASHARTVENLHQLVEEFRDSNTTYYTRFASGEEGRLNNLFQSLGLSLNRLKERPNTLRLLALCAVYESGLSGPMQKLLLQVNVFTPTDRSVLLERNLVRYAEGFLSVLPPVVRFVRSVLAGEDSLFDEDLLFQDGEVIAKAKLIPVPNRLEFLDFYADTDKYDLESVIDAFSNIDFLYNLFLARPILERLIENTILRSSAKQQGRANLLINLGEIDFLEGNNDNARKRYLEADKLYRKTGDDQGRANLLTNLGQIDFREGNNDNARKRYLEADKLYLKTGSDRGRANIFHFMAVLAQAEKDFPGAQTNWTNAMELYRKTKANRDVAETLLYLAEVNIETNANASELKDLLTEAEQIIKQFNITSFEDKLTRLKLHLTE